MADKHTPGPWESSGDGIWATSPLNARVRLATVTTFAGMNGIDSPANARLIAAAPDLIDGCNALLGLLQLVSQRDDMPLAIREVLTTSHRVEEARAAIAKAGAS